ncbi:hypothetical protein GCM10018790_74050 [Kitasatospora xanthocidica]|uniref:hypothetical protein n=1 Tax=Kitasatospora xanthocidica TaxID=83382 RepID=UPI00167C33F4|nr:hypothetical protein [Kitasatospora xanthocidica]GHF85751.1 hypothetical protein GCM10018790_74050 [Kitasatospora xanthocidica]
MTTPWPDEATFARGERVALTTPDPPRPELGHLGAEILGTRGVVRECVVKADDRDGSHVGPVYYVETEDGSPWYLRPEFLVSLDPTSASGTTTG